MESVPKTTTVETATAVLYPSPRTTGSAPSPAAAPQLALPVEVISAVSRSLPRRRPSATPPRSVPATTTRSTATAGSPTAATCVSVRRKP